jgi:hypothetical protein
MNALFRYEKDKLMHSGRFVLPLLVLFAYLGIAYVVAPLNILSSFSICSLVIFALMLSMGVVVGGLCEPMIEQTVYVKIRHKTSLYMSKVWLIVAVSLVFALISVLTPLLVHIFSGHGLFKREVAFSDIASGAALFWITGLSGGISGLFTGPGILPGRKSSIVLSVLFGLTALVKGSLIKGAAALQYVLWLLPPVFDLSVAYSAGTYFSLGGTWPLFLWLAAYTAVQTAAYVLIMRAKRFE